MNLLVSVLATLGFIAERVAIGVMVLTIIGGVAGLIVYVLYLGAWAVVLAACAVGAAFIVGHWVLITVDRQRW